MTLVYSPINGLKDEVAFPTTPVNEDAARKQVQDMFDQVKDYINNQEGPQLIEPIRLKQLSRYKSVKDSFDIFTVVDYKRGDGTLYMKSTLSGGTSPNYTTDTWKFYGTDGTTVILTLTWTFTYDGDGNLISQVVS